jgi:AbrB family looped-hinge helix DNA binding protein
MVEGINISKVIQLGNSLALVIPKEICEDLEIKKGSYLAIQIEEESMIIKKVGSKKK